MKRLLIVAVPLAATALAVSISASASGPGTARARVTSTVSVVEHATTDVTTDTGKKGDTAGDVLTFANDVYNASDAAKVGTDEGACVRTVKGKTYECSWTTVLPGGSLAVQGPFYDARNSTLAIVGGTGKYRAARGTMRLKSRAGGKKFSFVFRIVR
jgi:allene oxide cyclase